MNDAAKTRTKECIAIMQAFLKNEKIESKSIVYDDFGEWEKSESPCWDWSSFKYRIAPRKPRELEIYVIESTTDKTLVTWYYCLTNATNFLAGKEGKYKMTRFHCKEIL